MDTIELQDIQFNCILGCFPEERTVRRPVSVTVTLTTDISRPASTDQLADAVDYNDLTEKIIRFAEASSFNLIETLASRLADLCLATPGVSAVRLAVAKPHPRPALRQAVITICREKHSHAHPGR